MRYLLIFMIAMSFSGCGEEREEIHELLKGAYYDLHECSLALNRIAVAAEKIEAKINIVNK